MATARFFNTAGPVRPDDHYHLDPLSRVDVAAVRDLVEQKKYFILHAPRQTGKTSCLLALRDVLNDAGFRCIYVNIEGAQAARENVTDGVRAILAGIAEAGAIQTDEVAAFEGWKDLIRDMGPEAALRSLLARWAAADPRPAVLLVDEIDALVGDTLLAVLRQIRAGYADRPKHFPQSVVLCGVRDIRDYRMTVDGKEVIAGGSAFNIAATALRLGSFTRAEVEALLAQHTATTGQPFEPAAVDAIWSLTNGQPWLVNALAYETCWEQKRPRTAEHPVTLEHVVAAKEALILRRVTHLDQLVHKLEEPRVQRVIGPMLAGEEERLRPDDLAYCVDLGLVTVGVGGRAAIANPLYAEVIPRELSWGIQAGIAQEQAWYLRPDGHLDLAALLAAFQHWYREHAEAWLQGSTYLEAGPHLLLMAFLQRVVNGGGTIHREYALGRRRVDLRVDWPLPDGTTRRTVIEVKVQFGGRARTLAEGLAQTADYMAIAGAHEGHLVLVDRTAGASWDDRIFREDHVQEGRAITVWGM